MKCGQPAPGQLIASHLKSPLELSVVAPWLTFFHIKVLLFQSAQLTPTIQL